MNWVRNSLLQLVMALTVQNTLAQNSPLTADDFIAQKNAELTELRKEGGAIYWIRATYINHDSALLSSLYGEKYAAWSSQAVQESLQYEGQPMAPATRRALMLLRVGNSEPAPTDPARRKEMSALSTELSGLYGAGKYCPEDGGECLSGSELEELIARTRDYDEALEYWVGWRTISIPMRAKYGRFVELTNEGARELGFDDAGQLWRSTYDMPAEEFEAEMDRLWGQVKPLYDELHCHVRASLSAHYGEDKVPLDQPMPAHLLGNMWAQSWERIYDLLEPYPDAPAPDVTSTLVEKGYTPEQMVRSAESFYVSLGLAPLPDTFWERSMFTKPADREVQCHPSAWGLDGGRDLRIKMCIEQTYDDLKTIYHELGHNYYQRAYRDQPALFRGGANGGFHEAIGNTVALAMTPAYLESVGLVDEVEGSEEAVINDQMLRALRSIVALPWARLLDEWRWKVFSREISPDEYNRTWWDLREQYQGVVAPVERTEAHFDPGAKYHIAGNVPYARYFLANILQFQFLRALCDASGHDGALHTCSFAGSEEAGRRLNAMLMAGRSEPWQEVMARLTGTRQMDGSAIIEYFRPLMGYLEAQNANRQCGW